MLQLGEAGAAMTADPMIPVAMKVGAVRRETADTVTLLIEPSGGSRFRFKAGQFNMLYAFAVGEVPISISSNPLDAGPVWHTVRDVGAVSRALTRLTVGETLGVRGPFGSNWPIDEAAGQDVVIIAGGVGLAPLRPAIAQVLGQRDRFGRVVVLYGARTPGDLLFAEELAGWRARFDVEVRVTVDHALSGWRGQVGVVPSLIPDAGFETERASALVVGPEVMMRFTIAALRERGVAADHIYLSLERNMRCAIGWCGHCQLGPWFVCKEGPVFRYDQVQPWLGIRQL
ncbi:MAG TPA: FAD/NAD(P)-binding protein [Candidatus Dormibacteraeota bacterium]|nr:FAD/NAD(P)-binding protein [Candidatus Dormibacteraeota bacterium]